jgi:Glyoxalase-like domain
VTVGVRLRQVVLAARDLEPVAAQLESELGVRDPFHDPGVGTFGLRNAVYALGDTFIEIVSPIQDDTAAGRYLDRKGGDCGYMLIFQLDDLDAARTRVKEMGIRVVWQADLDDISGTHLHPADMRGAIVSLDRADPPESWRWGGPSWIGSGGAGAPGRVVGAAIDVVDPNAVGLRWGSVLGVEPIERVLDLDGGSVVFNPCTDEHDEGLTRIAVLVPDDVRRDRTSVEIGGVEFNLFG